METTLDGLRDIRVYQNRDGYRFSVDALLLYAFADVRYAHHIADLGTGSGIIGLLLARKYPGAKVLLIELQKSLLNLAQRNIALNALEERVTAELADIKLLKSRLEPLSFDMVVSNPPYRRPKSGRLSVGEEKAIARHEIALSFSDLATAASHLLKMKGRFFVIFHPERLLEAADHLRKCDLEPKRLRFVHNDPSAESKIVLIEAVKGGKGGLKTEAPLILYKEDGTYTDEVRRMYGKQV